VALSHQRSYHRDRPGSGLIKPCSRCAAIVKVTTSTALGTSFGSCAAHLQKIINLVFNNPRFGNLNRSNRAQFL
jgi:hypothetical protein